MKNIFYFVILSMLMFSCKVIELSHIPQKEIIKGIDFRKYTEKGFLITPEKYNGEYESIGIINYLIMPEANRKIQEVVIPTTKSKWEDSDYIYRRSEGIFKWVIKEVDVQIALDGIYKQCIEIGADALVNFSAVSENEEYLYTNPPLSLKGIRITGFAIKRK